MPFPNLTQKFPGKRVVFVSGNFNIIHPGHLRLLSFARSCGDVLLVGLFSDGSSDALLKFEDRRDALLALEAVSEVLELDPRDLLDALVAMQPDVVVKGKEHEALPNPEQAVVDSYGGHLFLVQASSPSLQETSFGMNSVSPVA
jgi:cytidyltransferase-like protein